jgi:4,5-DOPA dioxygenase extradiol
LVWSDDFIVNTDLKNPLVYDFYNFPKVYYEQTFESHGESVMIEDIKAALGNVGISVKGAERGPDHGVWSAY